MDGVYLCMSMLKLLNQHKWGIIQLIISILFTIKCFKEPTNIGQVGPDNLILYLLGGIIFTFISLISYFRLQSVLSLIPVIILALTIVSVRIGLVIEKNNKSWKTVLLQVSAGHGALTLYTDSSFIYSTGGAEYRHYERGKYKLSANKFILDKEIIHDENITSDTFYINDTALYTVTDLSYLRDTIIWTPFKQGHWD